MSQSNEETSENISSDINSSNSDESNSENNESISTGGASEAQNAYRDNIDQLPYARKWTKSHVPDLIIGDPDAGVQTRTANECHYH